MDGQGGRGAAGPGLLRRVKHRRRLRAFGHAGRRGRDRRLLDRALGRILERTVLTARLSRAVVSGGDTSGRAVSVLGIDALTAIAPLAPFVYSLF